MKNDIHIFYIKQSEKLPNEIFQRFLLQLPEVFQQDINAYKHWESAQASLLGKIILQYGFQQLKLNYSLHDIKIGKKERPFINDIFDFNISHSGEYVICAITSNAKVGIDIEKHRNLKQDIASRYFNEEECAYIKASSDKVKSFFDFWSIKESAIKCDGRGVEILSQTFILLNDNLSQPHQSINCVGNLFYFQQLSIEKNYATSVCSNKKFNVISHKLSLEQL